MFGVVELVGFDCFWMDLSIFFLLRLFSMSFCCSHYSDKWFDLKQTTGPYLKRDKIPHINSAIDSSRKGEKNGGSSFLS